MVEEEVWINVPEGIFKTQYAGSSAGEVLNVDRGNIVKGNVMRSRGGHLQMKFTKRNGETEYIKKSRLIAILHLGGPPGELEDYVVHHLNEDNQDNRIENLVWMSQPEHTAMHNAKLTIDEVREIRRLHEEEGWGARRLAEKYGKSRRCIQAVIKYETWKWVENE